MKNKKGFTLVELLGVVLLLAILLVIAIPSIMRYMKNGTKSYYRSLESELKVSGVDYMETYRTLLPKNIGHVTVVELQELIDNKYIDPVKDEKGNLCEGQVTVKKVKTNSYEYHSCLKCGEYYESEEQECNYSELDNEYEDSGDYRIETDQDYYRVNQLEEFVSPLARVYYKDQLIKEDLVGHPKKVDTSRIGVFEVTYYYHGAVKKIQVEVVDVTAPGQTKIVMKYNNKNGKNYKGNWYSGDIYVQYKASDYTDKGISGIGIDYYEVSDDGSNFHRMEADNQSNYEKLSKSEHLMKREGNYVRYVRAVDKAGNIGPVQSYRIKIDKTIPTCSIEVKTGTYYSPTGWWNTSITIGWVSRSGTISQYMYSSIDYPSITSPVQRTVVGTLIDEAGNIGHCYLPVKVDNKTPSAPNISASDGKSSGNWHNTNFTLNFSGANNLSGNLYYYNINSQVGVNYGRGTSTQSSSASVSTETNSTTYYSLVCSVAGLCSGNSSYLVKLDKTPPTCTWVEPEAVWKKGSATITATCHDNGGGGQSGCVTSTQSWTETDAETVSLTFAVSDQAGNPASSSCTNPTARVYRDNDPPTCTWEGMNKTWKTGSVNIITKCHDDNGGGKSGCTVATQSQTVSESTKTKAMSFTYQDAAGNAADSSCSNSAVDIYIDNVEPTIDYVTNPLITVTTNNYNFLNNTTYTCNGPSECEKSCSPATSTLSAGEQNPTCTITNQSGLSDTTTFKASYSYDAKYCKKTCTTTVSTSCSWIDGGQGYTEDCGNNVGCYSCQDTPGESYQLCGRCYTDWGSSHSSSKSKTVDQSYYYCEKGGKYNKNDKKCHFGESGSSPKSCNTTCS